MRTFQTLALVAAALLLVQTQCLAMMRISFVDKELAREMGIEVRVKENGPSQVWVELEFPPNGNLKHFKHVSLEIRDGERFLVGYAPLEHKRTDSGNIQIRLLVDRVFAANVSLRIVAGEVLNPIGFDLKMKEFLTSGKAP